LFVPIKFGIDPRLLVTLPLTVIKLCRHARPGKIKLVAGRHDALRVFTIVLCIILKVGVSMACHHPDSIKSSEVFIV
jgi:hypothetical protein